MGTKDGVLYALDAENGNELWSFETGGAIRSAPWVEGGKIFCSSQDGTLYVLGSVK